MIKLSALLIAGYTIVLSTALFFLYGLPMAESCLMGGFLMLFNLLGIALLWHLVFSKKSIALAVFSSSSTLLNSFILNRVPGAIAAGIPFITVPTFFGDLQTDIPQDFLVARTVNPITSVVVRVPAGAKFLFVAAHDSHYSTNQDPDSDYKVSITPFTAVPEPSIHQLLTLGLAISLSVFAKRRLMKRPHPPS